MATVYILSKSGKALMPTTRCGHIRLLLKEGKARVVDTMPFTVQLMYDTDEVTQSLCLGIDPGRENVGISVITEDGTSVMSLKLITRNKEIPKLMQERKAFRQKHRHYGRRCRRQRRALRCKTYSRASFERMLPKYEKPVTCKWIKNKEARFCNRSRDEKWLTPTANQLLLTHLNLIKKVMKFLPITDVSLEMNKFATMRLQDPNTRGIMFQRGKLYGYDGVNDYISKEQKGKCFFCDNDIDCFHHLVPRHLGGSNTADNIAGLCEYHHSLVHTNEEWRGKLKKGKKKEYAAIGILNQIFPKLIDELEVIFPHHLYLTNGYETYAVREVYGIEKDHHLDAYIIACNAFNTEPLYAPKEHFELMQFRRHDRRCCEQENISRKYLLGKEVIAVNRHKAYEQKKDSLEEYIAKGGRTDNLKVQKHFPTYQRRDRVKMGSIAMVNGERKVMTASKGFHNGKSDYYKFADGTKITPRNTRFVKMNEGIVFVSKTMP